MSRFPVGDIGPGQIARFNGIHFVGLNIGSGLEISGNTLNSTAAGGAGEQGPRGEKGEKGDNGSPGPAGADGAAFANIDGGDADDTFGGTSAFDGGGA